MSYFPIEQLSSLNRDVAQFTLALPSETDNALIGRMITSTVTGCIVALECGYTGRAAADEKDQPTTDPKKDKCSGLLTGCKVKKQHAQLWRFCQRDKLG